MKKSLAGFLARPFDLFLRTESASSILLLVLTVAAFLIANSGLSETYFHILETPLSLPAGTPLTRSLADWISEGLMTLFFFIVGLEIKREFISGALNTWKQATLPVFGALGGMVVPAVLFLLFNHGTANATGWGIPMATDIAFALGVVTLLGKRVSPSLKVFLIALAIIDDIGAVIVIALFYTRDINIEVLISGLSVIGLLLGANALKLHSRWIYALGGIIVWYLFLQSGVHATVAGVLVASTIPAKIKGSETETTLAKFEHMLGNVVSYCIVPLFVFTSAGVRLEGQLGTVFTGELGLGILVGLVVGKPIGIFLFSIIASKIGLAKLPEGVAWGKLFCISILGGIGFTMSIFITGLAFTDPAQVAEAKLAIFAASLCASATGWAAFSLFFRRNHS